jgi:hypothetical protein
MKENRKTPPIDRSLLNFVNYVPYTKLRPSKSYETDYEIKLGIKFRSFITNVHCAESYPSLVLPSVHLIIETLNLHVIAASWDLQVAQSTFYSDLQLLPKCRNLYLILTSRYLKVV